MGLFRRKPKFEERSVPDPDWNQVSEHFQSQDEQEVESCAGWSVTGDIDHPCCVYLTDRAIYVDITPDTLAPRETIVIPFSTIGKSGLGPSDMGSPRLVIIFDPVGRGDANDVRGVGVDLRPADWGWTFGKLVLEACG